MFGMLYFMFCFQMNHEDYPCECNLLNIHCTHTFFLFLLCVCVCVFFMDAFNIIKIRIGLFGGLVIIVFSHLQMAGTPETRGAQQSVKTGMCLTKGAPGGVPGAGTTLEIEGCGCGL